MKITIESDAGQHSVSTTLQGNKAEQLEAVLGSFEDVLAAHFDIDPMTNSLDIVDAVALD